MGKNPSKVQGEPHLPITNVSWKDIQEFIQRLNSREGKTKYRLPTEAEWEYAARANSVKAYSFGDDSSRLNEYAWYLDNSDRMLHKVGQRRPNVWGLYDIYGNVREWVQDWYGAYPA